LYFSFWDRAMGTLDKNYEKEFIALKERYKP
jgi:sterol desaturase/sphingolipid hydroxylase (fatty acid hydroxylase superfamily)